MIIAGHYEINDDEPPVAVQWNDLLAHQFPHAEHRQCRQEMRPEPEGPTTNAVRWVPYTPARCRDWHCPVCGEPTNLMGHHTK